MPHVDLGIPSKSPYVAVVRLAVVALARAAGLDEDHIDDLKIAVSEACTSAVLAHEASGIERPVTIHWSEDTERVIVEVRTSGGSDAALSPEWAGAGARLDLSTALLGSLVDECEVSPLEGGGTRTRLAMLR